MDVLQHRDPPAEVAAVRTTGQMHTMILLDENRKPLGRALLWNDGRAAKDGEERASLLISQLDKRYWANAT